MGISVHAAETEMAKTPYYFGPRPRPPLRDPAPYLAKTAFPLELTLGTFFLPVSYTHLRAHETS